MLTWAVEYEVLFFRLISPLSHPDHAVTQIFNKTSYINVSSTKLVLLLECRKLRSYLRGCKKIHLENLSCCRISVLTCDTRKCSGTGTGLHRCGLHRHYSNIVNPVVHELEQPCTNAIGTIRGVTEEGYMRKFLHSSFSSLMRGIGHPQLDTFKMKQVLWEK